METRRIAINGFGRIGRLVFKVLSQRANVDVVAINDLTDPATLSHLLKYDSVHGPFKGTVSTGEGKIIVDGEEILIFSEKDPEHLPWKEHNIDIVLDSTGRFRTYEDLNKHLIAGAKKVILSAPAKDTSIPTLVLGVTDIPSSPIISNASCTTNCLAPMTKVLDDLLGIEDGFITTVHAFTADQQLVDSPHKDLRRARSAPINIIPTSTGAANATVMVLPHLKGKIRANAYRVPVADGSITDCTFRVKKTATAKEINDAFLEASTTAYKNIIQYSEDPLVSTDIIGNPHSCIFDAPLTQVQGNLVKIVGWYDNETGYSNRVADVITGIGF